MKKIKLLFLNIFSFFSLILYCLYFNIIIEIFNYYFIYFPIFVFIIEIINFFLKLNIRTLFDIYSKNEIYLTYIIPIVLFIIYFKNFFIILLLIYLFFIYLNIFYYNYLIFYSLFYNKNIEIDCFINILDYNSFYNIIKILYHIPKFKSFFILYKLLDDNFNFLNIIHIIYYKLIGISYILIDFILFLHSLINDSLIRSNYKNKIWYSIPFIIFYEIIYNIRRSIVDLNEDLYIYSSDRKIIVINNNIVLNNNGKRALIDVINKWFNNKWLLESTVITKSIKHYGHSIINDGEKGVISVVQTSSPKISCYNHLNELVDYDLKKEFSLDLNKKGGIQYKSLVVTDNKSVLYKPYYSFIDHHNLGKHGRRALCIQEWLNFIKNSVDEDVQFINNIVKNQNKLVTFKDLKDNNLIDNKTIKIWNEDAPIIYNEMMNITYKYNVNLNSVIDEYNNISKREKLFLMRDAYILNGNIIDAKECEDEIGNVP